MLYYILPPIVIVISLAILISFLFRKVAQIPSEELLNNDQEAGVLRAKMKVAPTVVGHFTLRILERMMHKFKLMSLKFHNISNEWFHSIRRKREKGMKAMENARRFEEQQRVRQEQELEQSEVKITRPEVSIEASEEEELVIQRQRKVLPKRPMLRGDIVRPDKEVKVERKEQLEDVLIKRIAINPKDIEAYERLGDYYMEQLNLLDALECYKQVLKLSPVNYKAKSKIRKIERELA
jgi:hypothetical protein